MQDFWSIAKPILEAGVLGALLLLAIRMWIFANKRWQEAMQEQVKLEKEHSKEILKLHANFTREISSITRQYDTTLNVVNGMLERMLDNLENGS